MMELEEKLAKTDLNVFKMKPLEHLAKEIVRYQLFKTEVALSHINYATLSKSTAIYYFNNAVRYLNGKANSLSKPFRANLDKFSKEYTPLRPKEEDKRQDYSLRTNHKTTKPDIVKPDIIENIPEPKRITEEIIYGVVFNNVIVTYDTAKELNAFKQGVKFADNSIKMKEIHLNKNLLDCIQEGINE